MRSIARRIALTAAVAVAALAVPADADQSSSISLNPAVAGKASTVTIDFTPPQDPAGQNPQTVVIRIARGFKFDPKAVAESCDAAHAKGNNCPGKSKIGGGTADVTVSSTTGLFPPEHLTATIELFVAPPPKSGDVSGVVVHVYEPQSKQQGSITGRIVKEPSGQFGLDARFDNFDKALQPPAGFKVQLDKLHISFGAGRTVKKKVKKHGKKKIKKVRHDLVTNPKTCTGSWPFEVDITWADQQTSDGGAVPCTAH